MPQMAPLNWTFMFLIFIVLMLIMLNKIYFIAEKDKESTTIKNMKENNQHKWMW